MKVKGKVIAGVITMVALVVVIMPMLPLTFGSDVTPTTVVRNGYIVNPDNVTISIDGNTTSVVIGQNVQFMLGGNKTGTVAGIGIKDTSTEGHLFMSDSTGWFDTSVMTKEGSYNATYGEQWELLAVQTPVMDLRFKVGTDEVSSICRGTPLGIDFTTNLDEYDCVDLVVITPEGYRLTQNPADPDQKFYDINVSQVLEYGSENESKRINTTGWKIGTYTFSVRTEEENARGLDACSAERTLAILKAEVDITAEKTSVVELEKIRLTVTGAPKHNITISSSDPAYTTFPAGYEDNPYYYDASGFNDTIDADGIRRYVVYFNDTGTYTITVTDTTAGLDDSVDISVSEKQVTFDVPAKVVIGTKFTIKGCTNIGDTVDIAVEDYVYPELNDLIIDENGEFDEEIDTATTNITSFTVPGPVILKAYIDRAAGAGEVEENETEDGSVAILMISGHLTAELSTYYVALGDDFTVSGTAIGLKEVDIVIIAPNGSNGSMIDPGGTPLQAGTNIYHATSSVSTTDYTFSKKIHAGSDVDTGSYLVVVLSKGMDGVYGTGGYDNLTAALATYNLAGKTQAQVLAILEDATIGRAGSDDLMWTGYIKVIPHAYLNASISKGTVSLGGCFEVYGNAPSDYVEIVAISPKGGNGTGLDSLYGVSIYTVPTFTANSSSNSGITSESIPVKNNSFSKTINVYEYATLAPRSGGGGGGAPRDSDGNFYKKIKVDSSADAGNYTILVLSPGMDGVYGNSSYKYIDSILDLDGTGPELGAIDVSDKTQDEIVGIIEDATINQVGCDDLLQELYLLVNHPPIAAFTYSPENPIVNQNITFNVSASYDPDGQIVSFQLDFGDGDGIGGMWPIEMIRHAYSSAGNYIVNLTVTDNNGVANSTSKIVSVKENLIINGDFSDGLKNWTERGYGRGNRLVDVVYDDAINSSVLEFKRWNSGADGGMEGVYQNLSINVSEYKSLYLEADIKVISNTLGDSGWWSDVYGGDGEFPVHIYLYYKDENGTDWLWTHGFLPVEDYWNRRNYDVVNRSEWYPYISPNLVNVSTTTTEPHNVPIYGPPPKTITGIFLGGRGWDFCGRIDNAKLYGEKIAPTPSIIYIPDDYAKIQWAVDNVSAGSTIIVRDGIYAEGVEVNKRLTIRSENGSANCIVQSADSTDYSKVFKINTSYVNLSGFTISGVAGSIGIHVSDANFCNISNNTISNIYRGIHVRNSSYNIIKDNKISSMITDGIAIELSSNKNKITKNVLMNNQRYALQLGHSSNNTIYLNNFINNNDDVYSYNSTNIWNSTSKITYTYNGSTYTNYLGNYWSDYTGSDLNGDGIGDTPYSIDGDNDSSPLMMPFENYYSPLRNIFDTGENSNPYPSISGMHNGTLTPNQTINVSQLYTYPCPGTGGHMEYARIWNKTWNATATWDGYIGDWHNISFNETFVLYKSETYNYSIRTGSYPQIHHTSSLPTANGWINCTEFVDANGRVYYDWIPAIKLFL